MNKSRVIRITVLQSTHRYMKVKYDMYNVYVTFYTRTQHNVSCLLSSVENNKTIYKTTATELYQLSVSVTKQI